MPTTVLDFPSLKRFKQKLKKGYDYIGISFIIPNFTKAKEMTRLIRQPAPGTKIILGGSGVNIPGIEKMLDNDYICKGEGGIFSEETF